MIRVPSRPRSVIGLVLLVVGCQQKAPPVPVAADPPPVVLALARKYTVFPPDDMDSVHFWGSPDGRTLAVAGPKDELWLLDVSTGRHKRD